jgi:pseudaminic acid synthase
MSTGMASPAEISAAISAASGTQFALLHCVSAYPTPSSEMNLGRIQQMRRVYGCPVGLSDHSDDWHGPAYISVAMGACIIERHLMLAGAAVDKTLDAEFSLMPHEFQDYVGCVREAWGCLKEPEGRADSVHTPLRRSLFAVEDIAEGEIFTKDNVRSIRPGHGLPPSLLPQVLGRRASVAIERGTPLSMELLMKTEAA